MVDKVKRRVIFCDMWKFGEIWTSGPINQVSSGHGHGYSSTWCPWSSSPWRKAEWLPHRGTGDRAEACPLWSFPKKRVTAPPQGCTRRPGGVKTPTSEHWECFLVIEKTCLQGVGVNCRTWRGLFKSIEKLHIKVREETEALLRWLRQDLQKHSQQGMGPRGQAPSRAAAGSSRRAFGRRPIGWPRVREAYPSLLLAAEDWGA